MRRNVIAHDERPVDTFAVAPHRYLWTGGTDSDPSIVSFRDWLATVPYQQGDVVWLERDGRAVRARILMVFRDLDRWGDYREKYRVQIETKAGHWSRSWFYTWSGYIQRGYKLAGLAPDVPD